MNSLTKVILATSLINAVVLGGVAAQASVKNPANPTISQRDNAIQIAEASDGDGEMNDALEAQLEKKNSPENGSTQASEIERNQKVSEDRDGGDEARENPDEPNDQDGGNETQEIR